MAEQGHWSERGRATSVANADALGRPRRSVLSLDTKMSEPQTFTIKAHPLKCQHCGGAHFKHQRILLNTRGMTFFGLDWLNADADVYVCDKCGNLAWFASKSVAMKEAASEPTTCLSCKATIPEGVTVCPDCGWSYKEQ